MKNIIREIVKNGYCRFVAFGSSNTQRRSDGMHWFDCFDLGVERLCGRVHRCINSGVGGDNTRDLLVRFEQDVAFYKPELVFVTIGGNDASADPARNVAPDIYRENLLKIHDMLKDLGSEVVFQTYYAPDSGEAVNQEGKEYLQRVETNMDIVVDVAAQTGAFLIDHYKIWKPYREACYESYKPMMMDMMHVNRLGNMVMGLEIAREFGLNLVGVDKEFWSKAVEIHNTMLELADSK